MSKKGEAVSVVPSEEVVKDYPNLKLFLSKNGIIIPVCMLWGWCSTNDDLRHNDFSTQQDGSIITVMRLWDALSSNCLGCNKHDIFG